MDLSVAQEARVSQAGDEAQHGCVLSELQMILKSDEIVRIRAQIFLPQLYDCKGHLAGARIFQSNGLHGPETKSVAAAASDLLDGKTSFEVVELFPIAFLNGLRGYERIKEIAVFILRHGAVDVVGGTFVIARSHVYAGHIDRVGLHDRTD